MTASHFRELPRFLIVGVANTIMGLSVIYAAKWFFNFGDVIANLIGYFFGFLLSFALNSRWTFNYLGPISPAITKFLIVTLIAYAMNLLTVMIGIHYIGLNSYIAQALGIPPYTLTSYLASKYLVFRVKHGTMPR